MNIAHLRSLKCNLPPLNPRGAALLGAMLFALVLAAGHSAKAQTFTVLHNFTGGQDGAAPLAGLTMDAAGNLYGTAEGGGLRLCPGGCGTAYRLKRAGANWIFEGLYQFTGGDDGAFPRARVVFGPGGSLYGTTWQGGSTTCYRDGTGCGAVFRLRPPPTFCRAVSCPWTATVVYDFNGVTDAYSPGYGDLVFDQQGNIFGTTVQGDSSAVGVVYELTPQGSGWTESFLHEFFSGTGDGYAPYSGVVFDNAGNLYGTTTSGGSGGFGTVFQLTRSGSGWTETILHNFQIDTEGCCAYGGLIFDQAGNLYGATSGNGPDGSGTVFELTPSHGDWTFTVLYNFTGIDICGPWGALVMDAGGNLYGTRLCGGANGGGSVFKLTPSSPYWTYSSLHDFTGGSDGGNPYGNVIFDTAGNLYGTTSSGGSRDGGVVWKITP